MSVYRIQGSVTSTQGFALSGVSVYLLTQPTTSTAIPPTPLATIYTDATGSTPMDQPIATDGQGNWFMYAAPGTYTLVVYDSLQRIPETVFADQVVVSPGSGTVTSVALTPDGVIFTATGSPITSSGTLSLVLVPVAAGLFLAGPATGAAAAPTYRAITDTDIAAVAGSVSSVGLTVSPGTLFNMSITAAENPIIDSGSFQINLDFNNQAANLVLAGPASGGSGPVTARALVAADTGALVAVTGATPTCDCSTKASPVFTATMSVNTAPVITNPTPGQIITFVITSPGTWKWTWPVTFLGSTDVDTTVAGVTVQSFVCISSSVFRAISAGAYNAT